MSRRKAPDGGVWVFGPVSIASGASLSDPIDIRDLMTLAVQTPAAIDGAAALTLQSSLDGETYGNVYDKDGVEVSVTTGASRVVVFNDLEDVITPLRFVKIRMGTSASPVAQTAARTLLFAGRG